MNETSEFRSPRDSDGHGTHTASIAAGRYVFPASTLGYAKGVAARMAPKARLAAYKVCWNAGCYDSDILAAFDSAVANGVDVISLSVGGAVVPYYLDAIAIGAFGAADKGIFVSASAGNGGPGGLSVTNVAPWMATIGAGRMYPLVYAGSGGGDGYSSSLCLEGSLDPDFVKGKIVLCDRGINSRDAKGDVVKKAGGVGMIIANGVFDGEGLVVDCHVLSATAVGASNADEIRQYIDSASKSNAPPTATIVFKGTRLGVRPAPVVASFSARGPNPETPEILKPDVIAPGLNILAAWPDQVSPSGIPSDYRRTEFNILSGTSMACPHVSGLAALLKVGMAMGRVGSGFWATRPDPRRKGFSPVTRLDPTKLSPAAIKSALMTTAYTVDNCGETMIDESNGNTSTVFDFGSGHGHPTKAMDPGLVYVQLRWITQVTNVGDPNSVYKVTMRPPSGTLVTVEPQQLLFRRVGQKLNFLVRVEAMAVSPPEAVA
ncbi:Subtilisin-like protease SBT1.6 [Hibiscus syriacus]|uniref:Subtilisin-like protease SBT1.6 n=1 Tax=Hibiscus syriacus TaxID=106335 RepID=A0A6A2X2T9_HIBSY|nr:Subtilisin-like protease SBT1.6 [Hibiscus syriacus]